MSLSCGDTHNFGNSVVFKNNYFTKPRCLVWEYLFLSKRSGFRKVLSSILGDVPFPDLDINVNWNSKEKSGQVQELILQPLNSYDDYVEEIATGMAISHFFGISDLHLSNFKIGIESDGRFIFCPIDIESLFLSSIFLSSRCILPTLGKDYYGAKVFFGKIGINETSIAAISKKYDETISKLMSNKIIFHNYFSNNIFDSAPIRVIPRDTNLYFKALKNNNFTGFCEAEIVQLKRGDIPYFFTLFNSSEIFYYSDAYFNSQRVSQLEIEMMKNNGAMLDQYIEMHRFFQNKNGLNHLSSIELLTYLLTLNNNESCHV